MRSNLGGLHSRGWCGVILLVVLPVMVWGTGSRLDDALPEAAPGFELQAVSLRWVDTGRFELSRGVVHRTEARLDGDPVLGFRRATWTPSADPSRARSTRTPVPVEWNGMALRLSQPLELAETRRRALRGSALQDSVLQSDALEPSADSVAEAEAHPEAQVVGPGESAYWLDVATGVLRPVHRFRVQRFGPYDEREILIDRQDGSVRGDRSLLRAVDLVGMVEGLASEAPFPYLGPASVVPLSLPYLTLQPVGLPSVTSDLNGDFLIPNAPSTVTIIASLSGPHFTVFNQAGPDAQFLGMLSSGSPQTVLFNGTPTEEVTAEVAAFHALGRSRRFLELLSPGFAPAQVPVEAYVNQAGSCFAFYSPLFSAVYFTQAGSGCPNASYNTIVAHEYFHHLAFQLGSFDAPYEEAMADVFAAYVFGTPTIGAGFLGAGNDLRSLQGDLVFPNPDPDPAIEGLPLAQAFWDLQEQLVVSLGSPAGEDLAAELWLGSVLTGNGQLDASILDDVLLLDDDDGNVANGTPHFTEILNAFVPHGFAPPAPAIVDLTCSIDEAVAVLTWALPGVGSFDSISILRNGSLIVTLPGDAVTYHDVGPPPGSNFYAVTGVFGGMGSPPELCTVPAPVFTPFVRGDINLDGALNLTDVVSLLETLFQSVPAVACYDALDVNDSGTLNLIDATTLLSHLFLMGPPPPPPHPAPGFDPTPDGELCL